MTCDDARQAINDAHVAWDDVRERRVLGRVEQSLQRRAQRRRQLRIGAAIATAAAVVLVTLGVAVRGIGDPAPAAEPTIAVNAPADPSTTSSTAPTIPDASAPTMALADGSRAILHRGAHVDVDVQTDDLVRLVQPSGVVRYEVTRNPERRFVVDAAGVEVRVVGTIFTVSIESPRVRVAVQRGRVEVEGQNGVLELGAGDELSVTAPDDEPIVVVDAEATESRSDPATPKRSAPAHPSVDVLLARVDAARASGDLGGAAKALRELVSAHPKDPRTYSSYFQLGKIERARRRHAAAAAAFVACYERSPSGSLSEDARAEAAVSWRDAGRIDRAHRTAQAYLKRYPEGAHAERMRRILEAAP